MKKAILGIGLFILVLSGGTVAYAGSLNANEQAVISVAKGRFEVDGKQYKADSTYVNQLINYLSSDGVDLTSDQKAEAIATMYANVEEGVKQGYLHPIEDKQENTEVAEELTDIVTTKDSETGQIVSKDNSDGSIISGKESGTPSDQKNQEIEATASDSAEDTIIKNTGFNLNTTLFIAVGAAILMLICIYETIRSDFFAHTDE
jgi:hypothetical protein